jgi:hypothetical protein
MTTTNLSTPYSFEHTIIQNMNHTKSIAFFNTQET